MPRLARAALPAAVALVALSGCTDDPEAAGGHTHPNGQQVSLPVGDGTTAAEVGYRLDDVRLPRSAETTGEVSFRIDDFRGNPVTDFLVEQTKDLHLYVVRSDLGVFRHLHPTMADDGTWTAPVSLPGSGSYRVIAEFVARDDGGNGDHLVLGQPVDVPDGPESKADPADPVVSVEVAEAPRTGANGRLRLVVRDAQDRPVNLGTYLGAFAHVTGFQTETGSMLHLHPLGSPRVTEDGSELTFHTEISEPGDYRLFAQVRVDGFLHLVPVDVTVR